MPKGLKKLFSWLKKDKRKKSQESQRIHDAEEHKDKEDDTSLNMSLTANESEQLSGLKQRKTLVLDLDETLIHAETYKFASWTHSVQITFQKKEYLYYISIRPGLFDFLEEMSKYYVLYIYTCSDIGYAEAILNEIGARKYFTKLFTRTDCQNSGKNLSKDLRVVGDDLSNVVFLDDSERHIKANPLNGLLVPAYYQDSKDKELLKLIKFLKKLNLCNDVRTVSNQYELFLSGKPLVVGTKSVATEEPVLNAVMEHLEDAEDHKDASLEEQLDSGRGQSLNEIRQLEYQRSFIHTAVKMQC